MSISINSFPVLTPELFQKLGYLPTEYQYQYISDGEAFPLKADPLSYHDDVVKLIDERCEWTPDTYGIEIDRDICISSPMHLFGGNGLVAANGRVGLCVIWTSKTSNQRGAEKIGSFGCSDITPSFKVSLRIKPGLLTGSFTLSTALYVNQPGTPLASESYLAGTTGMILGILDSYNIVIDGNGSVFPIVEVSVPQQPLWWVQCSWTDPIVDAFAEDNIRICINNAHRDYGLLNVKGGPKGSPVLRDILASALMIIILKVKDSEFWQDTVNGNGLTDGSISQAINYFLETFSWDWESPERLAMSIRQDFDNRFR